MPANRSGGVLRPSSVIELVARCVSLSSGPDESAWWLSLAKGNGGLMVGRSHQRRRSVRVGSATRAAGLMVALAVVTAGGLSGCSGTQTKPTGAVKSWDSLTWSGPMTAASFSSNTEIASWRGGLVAATQVTRDTSTQTQIRVSADAIAWNGAAADEPSFVDAAPLNLVAAGSGLLLLGYRYVEGSGEKLTAWTSADGRAWQASDVLGLTDYVTLGDVVAGPGGFVATTYGGGLLWASSDGIQWHQVSPEPDTNAWNPSVSWVAATPAGYVAGGNIEHAGWTDQFPEVAAWWSMDGRSWQRAAVEETPGSEATFQAGSAPVGSMGAGYVGRDGSISIGYCCATVEDFTIKDRQSADWTSTEGGTWRLGKDLSPEAGPDWLLEADGGRIVALDDITMQIHESFDGRAWSEVSTSGSAPIGLSSSARFVLMPSGLLVFDPGTNGLTPARLWLATAAPLSGGSGVVP